MILYSFQYATYFWTYQETWRRYPTYTFSFILIISHLLRTDRNGLLVGNICSSNSAIDYTISILKIITGIKSYRCRQFYFRQLRREQLSFFFCVWKEDAWGPHMSQGCSSPRDLNIAPLTITAVTHRLIVTSWPRLYKRDLKLTHSLQTFFNQRSKQRQRHIYIFFFFLGFDAISVQPDRYHLSHLSDFVWEQCEHTGGRQKGGSHNSWTVERFSTPDVQAEVKVCWVTTHRPPACVVVQLGHVDAAGHRSATCGRCAPSHDSLSFLWHQAVAF